MAKEVDGSLSKGTFFGINQDAIGGEEGEDLVEVVEVLLEGGTGHKDMV